MSAPTPLQVNELYAIEAENISKIYGAGRAPSTRFEMFLSGSSRNGSPPSWEHRAQVRRLVFAETLLVGVLASAIGVRRHRTRRCVRIYRSADAVRRYAGGPTLCTMGANCTHMPGCRRQWTAGIRAPGPACARFQARGGDFGYRLVRVGIPTASNVTD